MYLSDIFSVWVLWVDLNYEIVYRTLFIMIQIASLKLLKVEVSMRVIQLLDRCDCRVQCCFQREGGGGNRSKVNDHTFKA